MSDVLSLGKKRAEELGLKLYWGGNPNINDYMYDRDDIHKILGEGVYTSCRQNELEYWQALQPSKAEVYPGDTHKALLIGIKPIVQESEERKLLREAVSYLDRNYPLMSYPEDEKYRADIAYRAKALLEKP